MMSTFTLRSKPALLRWSKVLLVLVILVGVILGVLHLLGRSADAEWQHYLAELRGRGEPLSFGEIEARRDAVPSGERVASVIERVATELDKIETPATAEGSPTAGVLFLEERVDFFAGIPRDCLARSRAYYEARRDVLADLATIETLPHGRFDITYPDAIWQSGSSLLNRCATMRQLTKLVSLMGVLRIIDGDVSGATATIPLQLRIAAAFAEEPALIAHLVHIALGSLAVHNIEGVLRVGEVDGPALNQLIEALDDHLPLCTMKWALRGERVLYIDMLNPSAASPSLPSPNPTAALGGVANRLPLLVVRNSQLRGTAMYTSLIDACDDPQTLLATADRLGEELANWSWTHVLPGKMWPSVRRAVELNVRARALLQCARVMLAAERFRLETGRLPSSRDDLVPRFLEALPIDPFDGQPLRLVTTGDGIVIYTIGEDRVDNGGRVVREPQSPRPPDRGLRLFRPERRGLLLIDPSASPDDR